MLPIQQQQKWNRTPALLKILLLIFSINCQAKSNPNPPAPTSFRSKNSTKSLTSPQGFEGGLSLESHGPVSKILDFSFCESHSLSVSANQLLFGSDRSPRSHYLCLSVRPLQSALSSSFWLKSSSNQLAESQQSIIRAIHLESHLSEPKILRLVWNKRHHFE